MDNEQSEKMLEYLGRITIALETISRDLGSIDNTLDNLEINGLKIQR